MHSVHSNEPASDANVHNARAYKELNEAVQRAESWLASRLTSPGNEFIVPRVSQRIVELMLAPFIEACADRFERGVKPIPDPGEEVESAGIAIGKEGEGVRIKSALLVRSLILFVGHWTHVLLVFSYAFFRRPSSSKGSATLVFGIGADELTFQGSDARFVEYCRSGPIAPLRAARRLIVQATVDLQSTETNYVCYDRFPMQALVKDQSIEWREFRIFLRAQFRVLATFVRTVIACPIVVILDRDFAYQPMAEWLNSKGLISSVIVTSSNYTAQPLWMRNYPGRKYKTNMLWYSQNTLPFVYSFDPIFEHLPVHRHISVDETWVWTEGFAKFLREIGVLAKIHVVGPILFYLHKSLSAPAPKEKRKLRIGVFDVSPVEPSLARKIWLRYNYYSVENTKSFLRDIASVRNDIRGVLKQDLQIVLKHKRIHTSKRDVRYFNFVEDLLSRESDFELVSANSDLYELIGGCNIVIVVPWSSPVYIAQSLGVPAIYYDPSETLIPSNERLPGIEFASGPEALYKAMRRLLPPGAAQPTPT